MKPAVPAPQERARRAVVAAAKRWAFGDDTRTTSYLAVLYSAVILLSQAEHDERVNRRLSSVTRPRPTKPRRTRP